ncbi:MAG: hypothetical protein U1D70_01310 [Methylobacter sp.]|jgi:hypothetical protein|nr:hypothetical protein [Methylobacter sp.]
MKAFILIGAMLFFGVSWCTSQQDRTNAEMFKLADEVFFDYIWELAIDQNLFAEPIIEAHPNGVKSYKWLAIGSENNPIGIEVYVSKSKDVEPELIPIPRGYVFDNSEWHKLLGTRSHDDLSSDPLFKFLCKFSERYCAKAP